MDISNSSGYKIKKKTLQFENKKFEIIEQRRPKKIEIFNFRLKRSILESI